MQIVTKIPPLNNAFPRPGDTLSEVSWRYLIFFRKYC